MYAELIEAAVGILEAFDHRKAAAAEAQPDEEDQYAEANELEYSDPYCKLSYAQHADSVGREVTNIKREFNLQVDQLIN